MTENPFAPKMTEAQRREAMRRYGRGASLNRIARDYGIGSAALTKTLKKRGLVLRKQKYRQIHIGPDLERDIVKDYVAGETVARIANERKAATGIAWRTIKESGTYEPAQIRRRCPFNASQNGRPPKTSWQ